MSLKIKGLIGVANGLILLHSQVVPGLAQKRGDGSVAGGAAARRESMLIREDDLRNRELRLRLLRESGKTREPTEKQRKLIISQIFEDFERIQIITGEMIRACSSGQIPDYRRISDLSQDLNKRAKRLKTNLAIPDVEEDKKSLKPAVARDDQQLKTNILTLNQLVKSFVTSPLFKDPRVTDVRELDKLRRNLLEIIELSQVLKRSAEF